VPLKSRFVIGIDLGTTNTVMAYSEAFEDRRPSIESFEIPQLVAAGTVENRSLLPSFIYLPGPHDLPEGSLNLPWKEAQKPKSKTDSGAPKDKSEKIPAKKPKEELFAVGEFGRDQGGLIADRLVASSKSWLCHEGVDRRADILPWGNEVEAKKISPVESARRLLCHLRDSWNYAKARQDPSARFEEQDIIITVPASFDEIARELTVDAAKAAGLSEDRLVLLEEPQAAFYAWLGDDPKGREGVIEPGDKVLVVDMGGGTTDLSLFSASVGEETVSFERTAVGEHLLLGGDNIDLSLARGLEKEFKKKAKKLSIKQWQILLQSCRAAKEKLLVDATLSETSITLPGKGSKLIGGKLKKKLKRTDLMESVLAGFFPPVKPGDKAEKRAAGGLQEFGLPFEPDPAVTRHLLSFLEDHCTIDGKLEVPRALLFNGGVFKTEALRERIVDVLGSWMGPDRNGGQSKPMVLQSDDLDLAVAHGAAYYGLVRRGYGVRIRGGLPRSYYLGIETGAEKRSALCLIPRGMEEGQDVEIVGHDLTVRTRRPVGFPLYTSTTRPDDKSSELITINKEDFRELPPLLTVLKLGRKSKRSSVPVRVRAKLTEIGTLELYCKSQVTDHEWRLNFTVRSTAPSTDEDKADGSGAEEKAKVQAALQRLKEGFRSKRHFDESRIELDKLVKNLEAIFGAGRNNWPVLVIRELWDEALADLADTRTKTDLHESRWLNLSGFCLRPGFGAVGDDHRVRTIWKYFLSGIQHKNDSRVRIEWLVTWRRVAGGLTRGQQEQLISRLGPQLKIKSGKLKGGKQEELNEAWRLAGSLENIPPHRKEELGASLLKAARNKRAPRCWGWALGRLGSRIPIYGTLDNQMSPSAVSAWIETLLTEENVELKGDVAFGLVQLARLTGDRSRDIDSKLREKVGYRLKKAGCDGHLLRHLNETVALVANEQSSALGDSIPTGLKLGSA
jgi:molecular chaperone DnaK (HSP70)